MNSKVSDLKKFYPDVIFICVPTPMNEDGSQDISIVEGVIREIKSTFLDSYIVLKSTVLPNHIKKIENTIEKFIYNPEFLREKYADEDFINPDLIVFGGKKENCEFLSDVYRKYFNCTNNDYIHTDSVSASFIKYSINAFLSTKVIFFNELYKLFKACETDVDWGTLTEAIKKDSRIGSSHMQVPGHDERFGFGGACLPKDSSAFLNYSHSIESSLNLLKKVIEINNDIRSDYKTTTDREKEQNIKFSKKSN